LLIVTHDRYLIRKLATHIWAIEDGRLWEFKEGYEEYRQWEGQRRQRAQSSQEQEKETRARTERERARKARRVAEREATRQAERQAELERKIHQLEVRRTKLEAQLVAASEQQKVEQVRQLGVEYAGVEAELDTLLAAWADGV
jgi:ATP-binding cassette subfamily F protein 3